MSKRKNLNEFFQLGKMVEFEEEGDKVKVWLQKCGDVDMEAVFRRSQAAKARFMVAAKDPTSDEYMDALGNIIELDDDAAILDLSLAEEFGKLRLKIEAQVEHEEGSEWAEDEYLQTLFDAWNGGGTSPGLKERYALEPEDPECLRVLAELQRYNKECTDRFEREREELREEWAEDPIEKIRDRAVKQYLDGQATEVWSREFNRQWIYHSVRNPVIKHQRYWETIAEFDACSDQVKARLKVELESFFSELAEGKASPATPSGSPSSEQPETVETSQDSGLADAPA